MENIFFAPIILALVIGFKNLPRRQPDTLAPIQLITLNGTAASVLLLIANATAAFYWWQILPRCAAAGFAVLDLAATMLAAVTAGVILLHRVFLPRRPPQTDVTAWMQPEIDALKPLVCGAHGIDDIRLYLGSSRDLEVEVMKTPESAGVRVGAGLPEKLAHFSRHPSGRRRRVRTLIRFILLHELGHILNGDHRAYQFARAMQLAQLWYLLPVLAFQPWIGVMLIRRAPADETAAVASMGALLLATALLAAFQRAIAERFASARERLADWRATLTLTAADRKRLFVAAPGEAPFLMMALAALQPRRMASGLAALLAITWPGAERIDVRIAHLIAGRSAGRHEPLLWSGLAGVNAGALTSVAISIGGNAVSIWAAHAAQPVMLAIVTLVATLPAVILVGRADRTDPLSNESPSWERRIVVGAAYLLAYTVVVIAGCLVLLFVPPLSPLQYLTAGDVIIMVAVVTGGSAYLVGQIGDLGPAVLRLRGALRLNVVPFLLGLATIIPLSLLLARGLGSDMEYPFSLLVLPTFAIFALGCMALQSRFRFVRALAPLGAYEAVGDIIRTRLLMGDVSADMNDVHRTALFVRLTAMWIGQFLVAFVVVAAFVMALAGRSGDEAIEATFVLGLFALFVLALWPSKKPAPLSHPERNLDTLHALFQTPWPGPLAAVLERLKPAIAADLRTLRLRDDDSRTGPSAMLRAVQLIELANAVGAIDAIAAWRPEAETILGEHSADGVVRSWHDGPPSAYWTAWAARLAAAIGQTTAAISLARAASRLLPPTLGHPRAVLIAATLARIASAADCDIPLPSANIRRLLRATDSLSDVATVATYIANDGIEFLRQTVRKRLWQALHANSRRGFLILLDLLAAGSRLGDGETSLWSAAEERLRELLLENDAALIRRLTGAA